MNCFIWQFIYIIINFWLGTVMLVASTPIWLFKQIANIIQLKNASLILARMDAHDHSKRD